jgi:hypothetical protein
MAKEMKAVIRAEVDPSGVVRGVNDVNRQLGKINKATAATAIATGIQGVSSALAMMRNVLEQIDRRNLEIQEIASRFSPQARAAQMQTELAKMRQSMALGPVMASEMQAIEQVKQRAISSETQRLMAAPAGSQAAAEDFKSFFTEMADRLREYPGRVLGGGPIANPVANPIRRFFNPLGDDFLSGQGLAGGMGSARGMSYAEKTARGIEKMAREN